MAVSAKEKPHPQLVTKGLADVVASVTSIPSCHSILIESRHLNEKDDMGQASQPFDPPKFSLRTERNGPGVRERGEVGHEVKDGEQTGKMSSGSEVLSLKKR